MAQPLEDDTLEKIHSYVKDMDINGTYVDMTEQLLMYRPENPIRFMVDYLSFKHKDTVCILDFLGGQEPSVGSAMHTKLLCMDDPQRTQNTYFHLSASFCCVFSHL